MSGVRSSTTPIACNKRFNQAVIEDKEDVEKDEQRVGTTTAFIFHWGGSN